MLAELGTKNMLPFLPITSGDAMATWRKKLGPPRHSTHALASIVERLKSSSSVFFRAEITARALMWNLPPFVLSIFSLFPPCSTLLTHRLHGCGGECEALIKPRLPRFKGLALSYNFPCVRNLRRLNLNFWLFQIPARGITDLSSNNHNFLENDAWEFQHSLGTWHGDSPALTETKG